jgi:lipopolysaccharide transport system ATP-binding protein
MSSDRDWVIRCSDLSKVYNLYRRPGDRLLQMILRGRRQLFTPVAAVRDLNLEIHRGETFGIVGRNGSGKSTFLQLVCGTLDPSAGILEVRGRVAALLELGAGFDPNFTGRENVFVSGTVLGLTEREIVDRLDDILAFADIGQFIDQPVKNYSSGMFARLAFAVAIHVDADLLVVDEALSVGDEAFQRKCFGRIEDMKRQGCTVLFVSHAAGTVIELCDRAMLMDAGECLMQGRPKEVVEAYHRLLFARPEDVAESRAKIRREGEAAQAVALETGIESADPAPASQAWFDPTMVVQSTVEYTSRGCRIYDVEIRDLAGRSVNVLHRGRSYVYRYRVEFYETCRRIRFGMMIKAVNGWEIGGMASHTDGDGVETVEAGSMWRVEFGFTVRFVPGTYFLNAGVMGWELQGDTYLHRLIDAAMFRVDPSERSQITGHVDVSADPICSVEMVSGQSSVTAGVAADRLEGG